MDISNLLYLSMMFYIVQCSSNADDDTQHLINQLTNTKMKIQGIISGLQGFKTELELTSNSELTIPTRKSKETMRTMLEATYSQIIIDVKQALKKGKNEMKVANCLTQAKTRLSTIPGNKESAFEKCRDDAVMVVVTQINSLNTIQTGGVHLIGELDSVYTHRGHETPFQLQRSIAIRLRKINKDIQVFATESHKKKEEVRNNVNNVFTTFKKCNSNILGSVRVQSGKAKHDTNVCLQRA